MNYDIAGWNDLYDLSTQLRKKLPCKTLWFFQFFWNNSTLEVDHCRLMWHMKQVTTRRCFQEGSTIILDTINIFLESISSHAFDKRKQQIRGQLCEAGPSNIIKATDPLQAMLLSPQHSLSIYRSSFAARVTALQSKSFLMSIHCTLSWAPLNGYRKVLQLPESFIEVPRLK